MKKERNEDSITVFFRDKGQVALLCRLYYLLDRYNKDYVDESVALVREHDDYSIFHSHQDPSGSEYARIQRALLHFELYRRRSGALEELGMRTSINYGLFKIHCTFLPHLDPCEMSELLAIYEYLVRRLELILDNTQDHLIDFIRNAPPGSFQIDRIDLQGLSFYGGRTKLSQQRIIPFITQLGLPFHWHLFKTKSTGEQMQIALS